MRKNFKKFSSVESVISCMKCMKFSTKTVMLHMSPLSFSDYDFHNRFILTFTIMELSAIYVLYVTAGDKVLI